MAFPHPWGGVAIDKPISSFYILAYGYFLPTSLKLNLRGYTVRRQLLRFHAVVGPLAALPQLFLDAHQGNYGNRECISIN